jgi:protein associated with RNAse G/E
MNGPSITILTKNYDGTIRKSWACRLIEQEGTQLLFVGEFDRDIEHPDLGFIRRGTISYEYYWLDRWINIFRFHEPSGELRNFYCNVNMPPTFRNNTLEYIDLDLDLLVFPNNSYSILDRDEYEANADRYGYPAEVRLHAEKALAELIFLTESGRLPAS